MDHQSLFAVAILLFLASHFACALANVNELAGVVTSDTDPMESGFLRKIHEEYNDNQDQSEWRRGSESIPVPQSSSNKLKMRPRLLKYDFLRNQWVLTKPTR